MRIPTELKTKVLAAACAKAEVEGASEDTIMVIVKIAYDLGASEALGALREAAERMKAAQAEQGEAAAVH